MVSDSSDSRSSSSSAASPGRAAEEELEAAEALADFAHLAMREGCGGDFGRRWNKRVKSESPPPPPREVAEPATRCSDLPQERIGSRQQSEKASGNVLVEPMKAEHDRTEKNLKVEKDNKLPNTSLVGSSVYSSLGCGKLRRSLTEAEKEARRMRRILANRESARQTIRRRQALCEELTKKAADLSLENDSLRREMEMAWKEYQILETTNKELKDQMAKVVVKAEVEEIPGGHKPACVHITPSSALPLFLYSHSPIFWPPVSQSENPIQASHLPQSAIVMPSNLPLPVEGQCDSSEHDNLKNPSGPRTPFYILPCPWFFPCTDHGSAVQSESPNFQKTKQEETSANNQCSATSSRTASHLETTHLFLPIEVKTEPSVPVEARITEDLNELPAGFSQDGGDQQTVCHYEGRASKEPSLASSPVKYMPSRATAKHENGLQLDTKPHSKTSSEVCHTTSAPPQKYCEPVYSCKKSAEAVAAAEARKRRKELTKLKNLHGRQCRMHC